MSLNNNLIDSGSSSFEKSLRFVKDDFEDTIDNILGGNKPIEDPNVPFKIVTPEPGFCIKTSTLIDKEKIFINVCQTPSIPPPEDITTDELSQILKSESSTFRVPMSITSPRSTKDKSQNDATVCDVAIHPHFFQKVEHIKLFTDFFVVLIFEAIGTKYNIQVDQMKWVILRNRKVVGTLIPHRIQNRDVKQVCDSYGTPPEGSKILIEELEKNAKLKQNTLIQELDQVERKILEYSLIIEDSGNIFIEFKLPHVLVASEIQLSVGGDCILLSVPRRGYFLNEYLAYTLDSDRVNAEFDTNSRVLTVTIPTVDMKNVKNYNLQ